MEQVFEKVWTVVISHPCLISRHWGGRSASGRFVHTYPPWVQLFRNLISSLLERPRQYRRNRTFLQFQMLFLTISPEVDCHVGR